MAQQCLAQSFPITAGRWEVRGAVKGNVRNPPVGSGHGVQAVKRKKSVSSPFCSVNVSQLSITGQWFYGPLGSRCLIGIQLPQPMRGPLQPGSALLAQQHLNSEALDVF